MKLILPVLQTHDKPLGVDWHWALTSHKEGTFRQFSSGVQTNPSP